MPLIAKLLIIALDVYSWIIVATVVISWLIAFDVIKTGNPQAANLVRLLNRLTEPVYKPLRKFIPSIGGIDVTPIIVLLAIYLLQRMIYKFLVF